MLGKLKQKFASWLLKGVHIDVLHIGEHSVVISGTGANLDGQKIENVGAPDSDDDVPRRDTINSKVAAHAALDTGVHGVGASTVCSETEVAPVLHRYGGFYWHTLFESLDGFDLVVTDTGAITLTHEYLDFTTGTTSGSYARLRKCPAYEITDLTWDKNRRIKTRAWLDKRTSRELWILTGEYSTYRHIGFKVIDNTLYGTVADGSTENELEIQEITDIITPVLEAVLTAGSQVEFFVDGVSKGTLSANIPTGTQNSECLIRIVFTNTAAEDKWFRISEWRFLQEANPDKPLRFPDEYTWKTAASPSTMPCGIGGDSAKIWHSDTTADQIYELATTDFSVVRQAASPGTSPAGIGGDSAKIWHCDLAADQIYELATTDFSVVRQAASPGTLPYGIGGDSAKIWHCDPGAPQVYELSTTDFSVVRQAASPSTEPKGIGGDSAKIWHCDSAADQIYQLSIG